MTALDSVEALDAALDAVDADLVRWQRQPDRKQALQFTAQGWALVEALAQFGDYGQPQHLAADILGQVLDALVDEDSQSRPGSLQVQWRLHDQGLTASVAFEVDALKTVAATCDMELGELQVAIQASTELSLLKLYAEQSAKQRLH
jgi:hypothetical protein